MQAIKSTIGGRPHSFQSLDDTDLHSAEEVEVPLEGLHEVSLHDETKIAASDAAELGPGPMEPRVSRATRGPGFPLTLPGFVWLVATIILASGEDRPTPSPSLLSKADPYAAHHLNHGSSSSPCDAPTTEVPA